MQKGKFISTHSNITSTLKVLHSRPRRGVLNAFNPGNREAEAGRCSDFEVSLLYRICCSIGRAVTQSYPVSKNNNKKCCIHLFSNFTCPYMSLSESHVYRTQQRQEKVLRTPGFAVTSNCEHSCGCCELDRFLYKSSRYACLWLSSCPYVAPLGEFFSLFITFLLWKCEFSIYTYLNFP